MLNVKKRLAGALLIGVLSSVVSGSAYAAPAPKGDVGIMACPSASAGLSWDSFTAYVGYWSPEGTVQVSGTSQGKVRVSVQFTYGSPGVYVRLVNVETNYATGQQLFTSAYPTRDFGVTCGTWRVEIMSASSAGNAANGQVKADVY